jgi:hypothetical protein
MPFTITIAFMYEPPSHAPGIMRPHCHSEPLGIPERQRYTSISSQRVPTGCPTGRAAGKIVLELMKKSFASSFRTYFALRQCVNLYFTIPSKSSCLQSVVEGTSTRELGKLGDASPLRRRQVVFVPEACVLGGFWLSGYLMGQDFLPFQYQGDKKRGGMTALAGLPVYFEFGHAMGHPRLIAHHERALVGEQDWTDDQMIMALTLFHLTGGTCVDDLMVFEGDEGLCRVLREVERWAGRHRKDALSRSVGGSRGLGPFLLPLPCVRILSSSTSPNERNADNRIRRLFLSPLRFLWLWYDP